MRFLKQILLLQILVVCPILAAPVTVHVWEKQELSPRILTRTRIPTSSYGWISPGPDSTSGYTDSGTGVRHFTCVLLPPGLEPGHGKAVRVRRTRDWPASQVLS